MKSLQLHFTCIQIRTKLISFLLLKINICDHVWKFTNLFFKDFNVLSNVYYQQG